jgi:lipoprotein-releasing system permease protein
MYEFDRGLALVHMADAARLFDLGEAVTGLRLAFNDPLRAPALVRRVALALGGPGFYVSDWTQDHANFFRSIEITKSMMFMILLMLVAVAAFNIVATLVMIVKEKQTDIAILRTLGAAPRRVMGIFITQGLVIGWLGVALGVVLGVALALHVDTIVPFLERTLRFQILDADVYYTTAIPAEVHWRNIVTIALLALLLTALATVYPAIRAARTAPAEALRYE